MDLYNAIDNRKSIRKYESRALDTDTVNFVKQELKTTQAMYSDVKVRLEFIEDPGVSTSIGMGFFHGLAKISAPHCIIGISEVKKGYMENMGFILEQIVLKLTDMGIGTCWLGTYNEPKLSKLLNVQNNKKITILITLGYPYEQNSFRNNGLRNLISSTRKKDTEVAFYNEWEKDAGKYLSANPEVRKALNMAILAPSNGNKQPVYVIFSENTVAIFAKNKKNNSVVNPYAEMDAGIFASHFYLCCLQEKLNISFFDEQSNSHKYKMPGEYSYIISLRTK
jgi:nitroreductase